MTPPAQPNDVDEFRITGWQLQQIVWAVLSKPVESLRSSEVQE